MSKKRTGAVSLLSRLALLLYLSDSLALLMLLILLSCGRWREALTLRDTMRKNGLTPDVYTYSACIDACAKAKQWKKACELLDNMPAAGVKARSFLVIFIEISISVKKMIPDYGVEILAATVSSAVLDETVLILLLVAIHAVRNSPRSSSAVDHAYPNRFLDPVALPSPRFPTFPPAKRLLLHRGDNRLWQSNNVAGGPGTAATDGRRRHSSHYCNATRRDGCVINGK